MKWIWIICFIILLHLVVFYSKAIRFFFKKNQNFFFNFPKIFYELCLEIFRSIRRFLFVEIIPLLKWGFFRIISGRGTHYNFELLKDFRWRIKMKATKVVIVVVIIWGCFIFLNFIRNSLIVGKDLHLFFYKKSVMFFFLFFLHHFNDILF